MKEIRGTALVTNNGIKFGEMYYSCANAISERWFERAWNEGNWEIKIFYDFTDISKIWFEDEISEEREFCNIIVRQSESGEKLLRYFESIEKMKKMRRKNN